MTFITQASQLLLSLSILVLIHELGHFFFARIFKVKVDKFYLFFDAGFALFRFKPKKSDTEYGVGWLPFGGYCKISGMIDESMDTGQLVNEPQPWEFRVKPAWQRLLIMLGGVIFNLILAYFIYVGVLLSWGDSYYANKDMKHGIVCDSTALEMGFRNGDKVMAINGKPVEDFLDIQKRMMLYREMNITLQRGDKIVNIEPVYYKYISHMVSGGRMIMPMIPLIIKEIPDSSINKLSGLCVGDEIAGVNGIRGGNFQIREMLGQNKGTTVTLNVLRKNEPLDIQAQVSDKGRIEVMETDISEVIPMTHRQYSILKVFPAALLKARNRVADQLCEVRMIFTPKTKTYKQVGSFISIYKIYSNTWNWQAFWNITAFLSIMLAVLNLLPIPALDGGHAMFAIYEIVARRKPGEKFLVRAQIVGMIILVLIMALAIGNDIIRHIL